MEPSPEEIEVLDLLDKAATKIMDWEPIGNLGELYSGLHTLQQFVIMHMLQREGGPWNHWYEEQIGHPLPDLEAASIGQLTLEQPPKPSTDEWEWTPSEEPT